MPHKNYQIRTMNRQELELAIEWAAKEGWNPGLNDAQCFYSADSTGFFIGLLDNQPIAVISAVKYGESFGFIGLYIVKPEYRNKGYGIQLWKTALTYLQGRNIGLDGVIEQQENYKNYQFKLAYRNSRYEGLAINTSLKFSDIVELSSLPFKMINAYDEAFFPANRSQFLKYWLNQPNCYALGIINNEKLMGYGVIRPCRSGYKLAPLFADTPDYANRLFLALQSKLQQGEKFYLDIPEVNPATIDLVKRHKMTMVFETARMYKQQAPDMPLKRIFGITSFELG